MPIGKDKMLIIGALNLDALPPDIIAEELNYIIESGKPYILTTNSYYVIKKLYLLAQKNNVSVPGIVVYGDKFDLKDGMPDNIIIDEAIKLHKEEIEVSLT